MIKIIISLIKNSENKMAMICNGNDMNYIDSSGSHDNHVRATMTEFHSSFQSCGGWNQTPRLFNGFGS